MKKTIFTLSFLCCYFWGFSQVASDFGPKDKLLADFETISLTAFDSLWVDSARTTRVSTPSLALTVTENPLPLENESDMAALYKRPKGNWKSLFFLFNKDINFSETPYFQIMVYPIKDKSPAKTTITVTIYNDLGEVIAVGGSKSNLPQDEWTAVNVFLGKRKSSSKYNAIQILINGEEAYSKDNDTEYLIDQIGFKAMADGSVLPATVFFETFGIYHQGWQDGKVAGMVKAERGNSVIYDSIKGFNSGIPWKFMNADTLATMEARTWGMAAKYEGASNNGRLGLSNGLKGSLYTGPIDVRGYSSLSLSFGIGTQTWWPYDAGIANARPRIEISVDGAPYYEIFSESEFLKATGEKKDLGWGMMNVYEDQIFTLVDYPLTTEDGSPLSAANNIQLKISYKAGAAFWIDDLWFSGRYQVPNAVEKTTFNTFNISPNPTTSYFDAKGAKNVRIFDLNGAEIKSVSNAERIDVSDLKNGVYIVKANFNGSITVGKLIKK